jgi:hypothetical protein
MENEPNILPWPVDYEARPRFVRPVRELDLARATGDKPNVDLYMTLGEQQHLEAAAKRWHSRPFGEKLVDFFRYRGDLIVGIIIGFALASLIICAGAQIIIRMGLVR